MRGCIPAHYFTLINVLVNAPIYPNPKPVREAARMRARAKRQGKRANVGPEHTALGGMGDWDRRGRVRASEITLSGAGRCSGRGRARAGSHSDAIVHAGGCIAVPQPEPPRMGSHK